MRDSDSLDDRNQEINKKISYLDQIVLALRNKHLTIFAGAGLSAKSGYVDWKHLLEPMAYQLGINLEGNVDLTLVAQYYNNKFSRTNLNNAIINEFAKGAKENENMNILATLPIEHFWTTNYDSIIEDTLRKKGRIVDVITEQVQFKNYTPSRDTIVYKMHGDKAMPDHTILIKNDYETYDKSRVLFTQSLLLELITNTVLFIGFGFNDPNFERILSLASHTMDNYSAQQHYCFMKSISINDYKDKEGRITKEKEIKYWQNKHYEQLRSEDLQRRYGIQVIFVDEFDQITSMLQYIRNQYLLNKVFISGGLDPTQGTNQYEGFFDQHETLIKEGKKCQSMFKNGERFIMELSKRLIDEDYDIISGFGIGVGNYVVSGAYMSEKNQSIDYIRKHIHIQPIISAENQEIEKKNEIRKMLLNDSGIVIFIFGKTMFNKDNIPQELEFDGTYIEYGIAQELDKIIIPIGITGFTAKYIYNEFCKNHKEQKELYKNLNLDGKNSTGDINIDALIDEIIHVLNERKKSKVQQFKNTLIYEKNPLKVFISFHYNSDHDFASFLIQKISEKKIEVVKEIERIDGTRLEEWIDKKIDGTDVTILLINENIIKSHWIDYEIKCSIKNNNAFVLIMPNYIKKKREIKSFLQKYKVNNKTITSIYPLQKFVEKEEIDIYVWIQDALKRRELMISK